MYYGDNTRKADVYIKTITPEEAKELLEHNYDGQRGIRKKKVAQFAEMMKYGKWDPYCGDVMRIDRDGNIIDGQHRLHACVEAGVPFETLYSEGFATSDYSRIDAGASRYAHDGLAVKNKATVAAFVKLYVNFKKIGLCHQTFTTQPHNYEVHEAFKPWMEDLVSEAVGIQFNLGGVLLLASLSSSGLQERCRTPGIMKSSGSRSPATTA